MLLEPVKLVVELLSETTFGSGQPTAGEVDIEVQFDRFGCPFIGGKRIHGMLLDCWLTVGRHAPEDVQQAALRMLGAPGQLLERPLLRTSRARLPDDVRGAVKSAVTREHNPVSTRAVRNAFSSVRVQTAEDRPSGAPAEGTLRFRRALRKGLKFEAAVSLSPKAADRDACWKCLAICCLALRRGGTARSRGAGKLCCTLDGDWAKTVEMAGLKENSQ